MSTFTKEEAMPFKSKAQFRKFLSLVDEGKLTKEELHKWIKETPDIHNLPERVRPKKRLDRKK
jgi:hypothetical protein